MIIMTLLAALLSSAIIPAENKAVQAQVKKSVKAGGEFRGRLIYIDKNSMEIKRGRAEIKIYFSDNSVYMPKSGAGQGRDILELCQTVRAIYRKEGGRNILKKIIVLREGNCFK